MRINSAAKRCTVAYYKLSSLQGQIFRQNPYHPQLHPMSLLFAHRVCGSDTDRSIASRRYRQERLREIYSQKRGAPLLQNSVPQVRTVKLTNRLPCSERIAP
jgi:hypothetical protein